MNFTIDEQKEFLERKGYTVEEMDFTEPPMSMYDKPQWVAYVQFSGVYPVPSKSLFDVANRDFLLQNVFEKEMKKKLLGF